MWIRSFMGTSDMLNERVFISGGSGVIGHALVNLLIEKGADIFVGDLKPRPSHWPSKVAYWQGDLNEIDYNILKDFAPSYYFHLAATFERTDEDYPFFHDNFHHNILLSHYLLDCLKDLLVLKKVIFASSYLIYDSQQYLFQVPQRQAVTLDECSRIAPRNLCGMAKLLHEQELDFVNRFKSISAVSARIFRSYGRGSRDIISRWIRALMNGERLSVYAKKGMFDFIFAEDVAEGLLRLAVSNATGTVNLGSGRARSIEEVLLTLKKHFPGMETEENNSDILFEASQAKMDLFQRAVSWKPENQLEDAIPKIIEYEKNRK